MGKRLTLHVSSTALVSTRFILLEWMCLKHNDEKTVADLFDIQDMGRSTV